MFDRMIIQAEVDYRRERLSRGKVVKRRRDGDRVRIPFVSGADQMNGRAR